MKTKDAELSGLDRPEDALDRHDSRPTPEVGSADMYANRRLAQGYPDLDRLAFDKFSDTVKRRPDDTPRLETLLKYLSRLVDLDRRLDVTVIGCGPLPQTVRFLRDKGHAVVGVEPVPSFVASANQYLDAADMVLRGAAEKLPFEDESLDMVFFESVLEHVESPRRALDEFYRVLKPGGIAYVSTTNRLRFSPVGDNAEFNVPFFNWFPDIVKESFVFQHLHYKPSLANFTERPAVHWWSFAELCQRGRESGFAQFYAYLDLVRAEDPNIAKSWLRRTLLPRIQRSPWLRAMALTQVGNTIFMLKRP